MSQTVGGQIDQVAAGSKEEAIEAPINAGLCHRTETLGYKRSITRALPQASLSQHCTQACIGAALTIPQPKTGCQRT